MVKAIVIDDEAYIRDNIKLRIETYFKNEIDIIGEASNTKSGISLISQEKPDLLFLDIHLQDGTSFDILNKIEDKNFGIIFITGYDNHAIKAIKIGALDYILKPIDDDEFKLAVKKFLEDFNPNSNLEKLIEISSEYFQGVKKKKIVLKTLENVYIVNEDDIMFCKSDGNYTTFYTKNSEKILISKPIKKVEELLSEEIFIRSHQSYIVNKTHVSRYNKKGILIMNSNDKIPVSSRRKDYVIEKIF